MDNKTTEQLYDSWFNQQPSNKKAHQNESWNESEIFAKMKQYVLFPKYSWCDITQTYVFTHNNV